MMNEDKRKRITELAEDVFRKSERHRALLLANMAAPLTSAERMKIYVDTEIAYAEKREAEVALDKERQPTPSEDHPKPSHDER